MITKVALPSPFEILFMTHIRAASAEDMQGIGGLLRAEGLPVEGVAENLQTFVIAEEGGEVVGAGGIERFGSVGLLRSVVVASDHRGRDVAGTICRRLFEQASGRGISALYLLTLDGEGYFARHGFAVTPRDEAPPAIRDCEQCSSLCPDSAVLMSKAL